MLTHHQGTFSPYLLIQFKVLTRGSILPFDSTQGQKPVGGMLGQELSLSSLPTKQIQPAAALPSTGARALSTLVSLDIDVQHAGGLTHKLTAPWGASRSCPSLPKSAREAPDLVEHKLHKEFALGKVVGPFESIPFPNFRVSQVGLVPKKDGNVRLIHHLYYPVHDSVNYHIDSDICTVKYSNIDEAVLMI